MREQARVQVAGREERRTVHEILEITEEHGLSLLPEPSPGDVFFDLEGDPFVGLSGRSICLAWLGGWRRRAEIRMPLGAYAGRGEGGIPVVRGFGDGSMGTSSVNAHLPFRAL